MVHKNGRTFELVYRPIYDDGDIAGQGDRHHHRRHRAAGARAIGAAPARDDEHVPASDRRSPGLRRVLRRGDPAGRRGHRGRRPGAADPQAAGAHAEGELRAVRHRQRRHPVPRDRGPGRRLGDAAGERSRAPARGLGACDKDARRAYRRGRQARDRRRPRRLREPARRPATPRRPREPAGRDRRLGAGAGVEAPGVDPRADRAAGEPARARAGRRRLSADHGAAAAAPLGQLLVGVRARRAEHRRPRRRDHRQAPRRRQARARDHPRRHHARQGSAC